MNRNENAALQLEGAQQRLSEALRTNGRNSTEYRNALRAVEIAQNNLNASTLQANVLNVAMGLNMVRDPPGGPLSIYSTLPALRQLITALKTTML